MYATIRRWRVDAGSMDEVMHRCDQFIADQFAEMPGFCAYHVMDCGDGTLCSMTMFTDEESARRSNDVAAQFVREHASEFHPERLSSWTGEVKVNRARNEVLEPAHA